QIMDNARLVHRLHVAFTVTFHYLLTHHGPGAACSVEKSGWNKNTDIETIWQPNVVAVAFIMELEVPLEFPHATAPRPAACRSSALARRGIDRRRWFREGWGRKDHPRRQPCHCSRTDGTQSWPAGRRHLWS